MKVYGVRLIENREFVGFFVVESLEALPIFIDQCTDPALCEYMELGQGGIYWPRNAPILPMQDDDEDLGTYLSSTCEEWIDCLIEEDAGKWKRL